MHGFGGTDREFLGVGAKDTANRRHFREIVGGGAGAMRVDVPHLLRRQTGVGKRGHHRPRRAFRLRLRDVIRVRGHAEAHDLRVDVRAACFCRFERFQHQHRPAFSKDHSAAILRERPASIG